MKISIVFTIIYAFILIFTELGFIAWDMRSHNLELTNLYILSFMLLLFFMIVLKKIYPLSALKHKIEKFADGDLTTSFDIKGDDEISQMSKKFDKAAKKFNALIESRNLFLRNIMHELKTPITKGRFSVEMLKETKQKDRLLHVFIRMEGLINEMALIEQIASGFDDTNKEEYRAVDVISEALDMGFFDDENYSLDISNELLLDVDYKLFATAIKNMIDNAIKYADDKKVVITAREGKILFENYGKELDEDLSYYIEPFTSSHKSKHSFGLGLYIVNSILESHKYKLGYEHLNGWNRFWFEL